jgi:enoyl-CoA hydratase/carnithine racemase
VLPADRGRAPTVFCAGNDIGDFLKMAGGSGAAGAPILHFLYALARCETPLLAAVQGNAVGIGTTMLMHCDHVVAASDARFSTPFVGLGLRASCRRAENLTRSSCASTRKPSCSRPTCNRQKRAPRLKHS